MRVHLGVKILCGGYELDVMVLSTLSLYVYNTEVKLTNKNDRVASVQHNRRDV